MPSKNYKYERVTFVFDGRRYEATGKTPAEAHAKAARKQFELEQGLATSGGNMPVGKWAEEWLETYKRDSVGEGQYRSYKSMINCALKPVIGNKPIKSVTEQELQKLLNSKAGKSKSYLVQLRQMIKALFHRAYRSKMIVFDPAEDLALPPAISGKRRALTTEERNAVLPLLETHHAGLWLKVMLYCGLRPGEARALTWQDVDTENRVVHVTQAVKVKTRNVQAPKTAAGIRNVPIPEALIKTLVTSRGEPDEPVLKQTQSGQRHTETSLRRWWSSFKRELDISMGAKLYRNKIIESKIAPDLVPYCFRHTYATDLQEAGVPLNVAKYLMGHSDISVTANIYTHTNEAMLNDALAQINAFQDV